MENNKIKDNKKLITSIIITILIVSIFGGTLAYYDWKSTEAQKTAVTVTLESTFECAIDGGGPIESSNYQLIPTNCDANSEYVIKREVKVKPTLDNDENSILFDVWINVNKLTTGLSNNEHFKYALTSSSTSCTEGVIASGNFNGLLNDGTAENIKTETILSNTYDSTTEDTYYLYIWLAREAGAETMNQEFSLSLNGQCTNEGQEHTVTFDANGGIMEDEATLFTTAGEYQYVVPKSGEYKLEVWGAQGGGTSTYYGGYGGYSVGTVNLEAGTTLYANVGGHPVTRGEGGYNGGGKSSGGHGSYDGGGASHIATVSGKLSSLSDYKGELYEDGSTYNSSKILIVAGGGGGAYYGGDNTISYGGHAGGYRGKTGDILFYGSFAGSGGTQTSAGCAYDDENYICTDYGWGGFGAGGRPSDNWGSAGGGGWYGGGGSPGLNDTAQGFSSGGGGSGYIGSSLLTDKSMYCYGCSTSTAEHTLTYLATDVSADPIAKYAKEGNGAIKISSYSVVVKNYPVGSTYGTLPTPTREDYIFKGWNTKNDGTGTYVTSDTIVNLGDSQQLYAIWESSVLYLYNYGTWNTSVTGELISAARMIDDYGEGRSKAPTVSIETNSFSIAATTSSNGYGSNAGWTYFENTIDLTNYKTLRFEGSFSDSKTKGFGIWSSTSGSINGSSKVATVESITAGVGTIDVSSLTGEYYIGLFVYRSGASITCKSLSLEK